MTGPVKRWRWSRFSRLLIARGARGLRFRLYPGQPLDGEIYVHGLYERAFLEFLRSRLPADGEAMLDVGANIGNHAIYLSDRFAQVHCFEPNPIAADRLHANIEHNRVENIEVHRIGLGFQDASLPFAVSPNDLGLARFIDDESKTTTRLPVTSGNSWVAAHGSLQVDFVKIDVEGFELEVLIGLSEVIRRSTPLIAFESWGDADGVQEAILETGCGYRLYEPVFGSSTDGLVGKAFSMLRHGREVSLRPVQNLKGHSYPYILAIPPRMLACFSAEIDAGSVVGATGIEPVTPPV